MRLSRFALLSALLFCPLPGYCQAGEWLGTWTAAAMPLPSGSAAAKDLPLGNQEVTVRQVVHITQGGKRMRISFTNEFGTVPLRISAAHFALLATGSTILQNTDKALTFAGRPDVTIAPGQFVTSDAVVGLIPIFSDVVITTVLPPQAMPQITYHALGLTTTWFWPGNHVDATAFDSPLSAPAGVAAPDVSAPVRSVANGQSPTQAPIVKSAPRSAATQSQQTGSVKSASWFFLKNVQVNAVRHSGAVITLGDSITDGSHSTPGTNRRWPDVMAALFTVPAPLLRKNPPTVAFSVLNAGISGNRILHDMTGPAALERFDRDVLKQPGAKFVIILEGINDVGNMHRAPADAVTEQQMLDAYADLAKRSHAAGLKFLAATILPYEGAKYYSEDGELIRQHINAFLRTSPLMDGVIDFEKVIADPAHPGQMLAKYDCGDHLHPSDAGYAAMGAAVNLKLFRKR